MRCFLRLLLLFSVGGVFFGRSRFQQQLQPRSAFYLFPALLSPVVLPCRGRRPSATWTTLTTPPGGSTGFCDPFFLQPWVFFVINFLSFAKHSYHCSKKQTLDDAYAVPANFLEIDVSFFCLLRILFWNFSNMGHLRFHFCFCLKNNTTYVPHQDVQQWAVLIYQVINPITEK